MIRGHGRLLVSPDRQGQAPGSGSWYRDGFKEIQQAGREATATLGQAIRL